MSNDNLETLKQKAMISLNAEQEEAARYFGGPLLILAGAGSGKTRVLTQRIGRLITEEGVPPYAILAITFTNKAAREMKSRVERMLPEVGASVWISTFHSACVRMLRKDIDRLGYDRSFSIADSQDQLSLIKICVKELDIDDKIIPPKSALEAISRAKDKMKDPERFLVEAGSNFRLKQIASIYALYQSKLKKNNALDFDDIIILTVKLLRENADVLDYYQTRFRHVLIDEYQDTNMAQYELVMALSGKWRNICAVGDDDQSIYGWRGANIGNILGFEKDFSDARVIKLEQNYRSTANILNAANAVISQNRNRKRKKLWTTNADGARIGSAVAADEYGEAAFIARTIARLRIEEGLDWNSFAVLYRMNAQSRAMENCFVREGVPYRMVGGLKFFDRKEIKDVLAYLRLISNRNDDISFRRVVNMPKRGIGEATVNKLADEAEARGVSLFEVAKRVGADGAGAAFRQLGAFVSLIDGLAEQSETLRPDELFDLTVEKSGIAKMYKGEKTEEAAARLENVLELKTEILEFIRTYQPDDAFFADAQEEAAEAPAVGAEADANASANAGESAGANGAKSAARAGLSEFLSHIALMSDIDNLDEEDERVSLMTIHSAKGLEFDTVFLSGAEEGVFPGARSTNDESELEEERRLCYVAITRAKKRFCAVRATIRTIFGASACNRQSRFIEDIPDGLIENARETDELWNGSIAAQTDNQRVKSASDYASESMIMSAIESTFSATAPKAARGSAQRKSAGRRARSAVPVRKDPAQSLSEAFLANEHKEGLDTSRGEKYDVGIRVIHKKYGVGTVSKRVFDAGDYVIEVLFDNAGMRRFIEAMANLTQV